METNLEEEGTSVRNIGKIDPSAVHYFKILLLTMIAKEMWGTWPHENIRWLSGSQDQWCIISSKAINFLSWWCFPLFFDIHVAYITDRASGVVTMNMYTQYRLRGRWRCEILVFFFLCIDPINKIHVYTWVINWTIMYILEWWRNSGADSRKGFDMIHTIIVWISYSNGWWLQSIDTI